MKRNIFLHIIFVILVITITSCMNNSGKIDDISVLNISDTFDIDETSIHCDSVDDKVDESGVITYSNALGFQNIREMKNALENNLLSESEKNSLNIYRTKKSLECDPFNLHELKNLDYNESYVEWRGGYDYSILYQDDELNIVSFIPFGTTEELEKYMMASLSDYGTYEALKNNELINNIRVSTVDTEYGEKIIYTYDTSVMNDLIDTYIEYYNEKNNTTYIVVESYSSSFDHAMIFAFNDITPFMCYCFKNALSLDEVVNLYSSKVID